MAVGPLLKAAAIVAGIELSIVVLVSAALLALVTWVSRRSSTTPHAWLRSAARLATSRIRRSLMAATLAAAALLFVYNGWLAAHGVDARAHAADLLRAIAADSGRTIGTLLAEVFLLIAAVALATSLARRVLAGGAFLAARSPRLNEESQVVPALFARLDRTLIHVGWLVGVGLVFQLLRVPPVIVDEANLAVRLYVVIAVGLIVIRSAGVLIALLDRSIAAQARRWGWGRYYDHVRMLLPTLRACLEYALWAGLLSLALYQVAWLRTVAGWGPLIIEGLAIFFAGQVVIRLGYLEIERRMLPREGLEESERRRRATMVPLVRSTFMYVAYFTTAVLILAALGFNPLPFLAGAGILGLVVGFGAQSMINDVVSGFFILFENIYLVGDTIEAGPARGIVEAIEFRTTKIRDAEGRLHILRNGDMKVVVNYSKDYGVAIVALDVGYDADLRSVFTCLRQAGEQLRAESDAVLGETEVEGITAFGQSSMTIRTSTRVKPGHHENVAATLRLLIKETFDLHVTDTARKTLIPERWTMGGEPSFDFVAGDSASKRTS
jgi:small-conductance mechanosensitive channel